MAKPNIVDIIRAECEAIGSYDLEELKGRIYLVLQDHSDVKEKEYRAALKELDRGVCRYDDGEPCTDFPRGCKICINDAGFAAFFVVDNL